MNCAMASLTPDQLKRIEENRLAALKRRENKLNSVQIQGNKIENPHLSSKCDNAKDHRTNSNSHSFNCDKSNLVTNNINAFGTNSKSSFYGNEEKTPKRKFEPEHGNTGLPMKKMYSSTEDRTQSSSFYKKLDLETGNPPNSFNSMMFKPLSVSLELLSSTRFTVQVDYNQKVIELLKTVPNRMYDSATRQWNFPLTEYKAVISKLDQLKPQISIIPLPDFVLKSFLNMKCPTDESYKQIDISSIEPTIRKQLYPFQVEGVQFGISKKGRCLIADDMGLGKTIQAIGIADYYRTNWPLLIVCPSSMRYQWEEDICRLLPNVPMHGIFVMKSSKDYIDESLVRVLILSYDLLGKLITMLQSVRFGVMILDESHSLKSGKSQRSQSAMDIVKKASQVILLSGTPALSRPVELYTQLMAIQSSFFGGFRKYALRYCDAKQNRFGWDNSGSSHMDELKIVLESKFMIRRLKQDVLTQLPAKIRQVVVLNSDTFRNSKEIKTYNEVLSRDNLSHSEKRSQMMQFYGETGRIKLKPVSEYIDKLVDEDRKFICFGHHKEVLEGICQTLMKKNVRFIRIDGKVQTDERKRLCDEFQFVDNCKVAVLSIKAANTGLTLTSAQLVVFAELFWNPGDLIQAEDRAHRIGQEDSVHVQYLLAKGTCDDFIWPLIESKLMVLNKAGLTKDSFSATVTSNNTASSSSTNQLKITEYFTDDFDADEDILNKIMDSYEPLPET